MAPEKTTPRWILLMAGVALFFFSAVAAGAALAFLPDWTAFLVVAISGYALWHLPSARRESGSEPA